MRGTRLRLRALMIALVIVGALIGLTGCVEEDTAPLFKETSPGKVNASTVVTAADESPQYLDEYGLFYSTNRDDIVAVVGDAYTTNLLDGEVFTVRPGVVQIPVDAGGRQIGATEKGTLSVNIPNLKPNTTYYGRFYTMGRDSEGTDWQFGLTVGSFKTGPNTALSLSVSSATPTYGSSVALTATLKSLVDGPLAGRSVTFQRYDGSEWISIGSATTDSYGKARKAFTPYKYAKTTYRAKFAGASPYGGVSSASKAVTPKVKLTRSSSWDTKYDGKTYYYKGYIYPKHSTSDSNKVKFKMYKRGSDGVYRWKKTVTASYSYYSSTKTRWTAKVVFPSAGRWRVRAHHAADSKNASSYSSYDYVTVK